LIATPRNLSLGGRPLVAAIIRASVSLDQDRGSNAL
jgi:hypothetical protein